MSDKPVVGKVSFGPKSNKIELTERVDLEAANAEDPMYYYKYARTRGIDYNFYGDWQKNYAKMVINVCEVIRHTEKAKPSFLDVGCACGVNTRAFKELNMFGSVRGCDPSEFMIDLGRKTHGFTEEELFVASGQQLTSVKNKSIDFIHCANVLEHCTEDVIRRIFNEFNRVLTEEGLIFLIFPAIRDEQSKEKMEAIESNITHVTIKDVAWWDRLLKRQFEIDYDVYDKFKEDKHSPDNSNKTFYDYYNEEWTLFLLTRR